ncbi:MAG: hypothetical protein ACO1QB_00635 [Verrucomicrobiales bacterium]
MDKELNGIAAAEFVLSQKPANGLFAGQNWRISPQPFQLDRNIVNEIEKLGRVLLQFYRSVNILYRKSSSGDLHVPAWCSQWLDQGKPENLKSFQNDPTFKNDIPRVIRPDILLTDEGLKITELDSVPGGIGLTAWLNKTYCQLNEQNRQGVVGGENGMLKGFQSIFGEARQVKIVVSEESETYRPEMKWLAEQLGPRFTVHDSTSQDFNEGDAVYRFFELYDLPQVGNGEKLIELAAAKRLTLTPPPKTIFEEKMLFGMLWNRNLREFWRQSLGESFYKRLKEVVPFTWIMDPSPLPPQATFPRLELTDWTQLKTLSQKERELILKISGFSEVAWGARGVHLGSDLAVEEWAGVVDHAINSFSSSPYVLQQFHKPSLHPTSWADFSSGTVEKMDGRVRLCPYYFVSGMGDAARAHLGGILATICPPDKKIIHGMTDAILAPVVAV